jgi:hypothetical protein|tara:strand:+ start:265 stop:513 length:249 start_codon:yes stop_codon:yes gene_type:complete
MPKKPVLPNDYILTYKENKKWGFVYKSDTKTKILKYSDVIFRSEKEAENEAYDWMFSNDTFYDPRRSIELEKMLFLHDASIH